jgi:putative Holliday junction resolvase
MSPTSTFISTPERGLPRSEFAKQWPALYTVPMRRLGIDLGTVRTGLAIAESEMLVATPLCTVQHASLPEAVKRVSDLVARERVEQAIVGLPLRLDGSEGDAARRVRHFAQALSRAARISVRLWDERLSTVAAQSSLRVQGVKQHQQRRVVDQVAATLLLQNYLDHERSQSGAGQHSDQGDRDDWDPA